jgi:hypothetical protein
VEFRREWQEQVSVDSQRMLAGRFGIVPDDHLPPIPAPPLPNGRLKERR